MIFKMRKRMVLGLIILFVTSINAAPRPLRRFNQTEIPEKYVGENSLSLEATKLHSDHEKEDAKFIRENEKFETCKEKLKIDEFVSEVGDIHCLKYKCLEKGTEEGLCNFVFAIRNYLKVKELLQTAPPRLYQGIPHNYTMQMKEAQIDAIRFVLDLELAVDQAQTSNKIHENAQMDICNIEKYCQPKSYEFYFSVYETIITLIFIVYVVKSCMRCETRQMMPIHRVADKFNKAPWYQTGRRPNPYWTYCTMYNYGKKFDDYTIMKKKLKKIVTFPIKVIRLFRNIIIFLRRQYRTLMD